MLAKRVPVIARPRKRPRSADVNDVKMPLHSLRLNALSSMVATGISIWRRTRVARLKNRSEAVFAGHRFYDFHASVAGIDLFAGSNHSRLL